MHFRETLSKDFGFEWCVEQPCLARNEHCCIMVHVDDVMFCGDGAYWDVFLKGLNRGAPSAIRSWEMLTPRSNS